MQYIVPAFVALAIGANAAPAPHWSYPHGFGGPVATGDAFPSGTAFPTGLVPTGTGLAPAPTAPSSYKGSKALARDDDEEDEEDEESSSNASSTKSAKSARSSKSAKSTKSSKDASSTKTSGEVSSTKASEEVKSTTAGSSATASAPATTSKASSGGGAPAAGGKLPASSGTSVLKAVQTIAAGESFDGGMVAYDRGVSCTGQSEGGDSDTVFYLEAGASLSNVIIGPNQIEGVHCFGACTLTNVWWSAVCEDAFTIKEQEAGETTTITGGGAFGAEDKVLQHNGGGTLSVSGFTVESFGKLYRSCGNCKTMYERHVIFNGISATEGKSLAGINSNYGDTATFTKVEASGVKSVCDEYKGNDSGDEPEKISSGPSSACIYSTSDVSSS